MEKVLLKRPQMSMGHPIWWHHHGSKMKLQLAESGASNVVIKGGADLTITRNLNPDQFSVRWKVVQFHQLEEVEGTRIFTRDDLLSAFALSTESGNFGNWLIDTYGADVAQQCLYIRWNDHLNIPCPGTGHDGDPNISIRLDPEMKAAVRRLVG